MKFIRIFFAIMLAFVVAQASAKEPKAAKVYKTTVYVVGVAA